MGGLLLVCLVAASFGSVAVVLSLLLLLFSIYLFRDPVRSIPSAPLALVCPVQGRVRHVAEMHDPWLDRPAIRIRISMSWFDVYSIRSVTEGKVKEQWHHDLRNGEKDVFQHAVWVQTDEGDDVVMVIHSHAPWAHKRLRLYLHTGERIGHGYRIGYMPLGGDFDVLIPVNVGLSVKAGQRVRSGATVLASMVHKKQVSAVA